MSIRSPKAALIMFVGVLAAACVFAGCKPQASSGPGSPGTLGASAKAPVELLNVSYDPTRELYAEFNVAFAEDWEKNHGQKVKVKPSHGGSGKQARNVIEGLPADVVTLALSYDIDIISEKSGLLPKDWQARLKDNSTPYTSTIVFLVRKGNPKGIKDWPDLLKADVEVITPNPKTSGGARWNYLAAWGFALKRELKDFAKLKDPAAADAVAKAQEIAKQFTKDLFQHVHKLDSGARDATNTFARNGQGDVLLAWENEAYLSLAEDPGKFEIVTPSISILAEPPVAVVDKNVDKKGTREVAEAYLKFLYTPTGQTLAAKHYYRPRYTKDVPEEYLKKFENVELFTVDDVFGGWQKAQKEHFNDGGVFDQIYATQK
jgi:sulfate/thiosulfate transport system substrate-binding protein